MPTVESPSLLDRFLKVFTDVRAGEGVTALLLSSNIFLLLSSYYVLKSIRDGLILAGSGAEVKAYTSALQVAVLAAVVPLYGKLADRLPRRKLINFVTLGFAVSFVGFAGVVSLGFDIGVVFFVWVSVFAVMIMAQFWSFANDLYTREDGERLFPLVAFGQSAGAVVGATYAAQLTEPFGIPNLLLGAVVMLGAALLISNYIDARERSLKESHLPLEETSAFKSATRAIKVQEAQRVLRRFTGEPESEDEDGSAGTAQRSTRAARPDAKAEPDTTGAFALVLGTRYLLMIGLLMLLLNFVNTTGGYILDRLLEETAASLTSSGQAGGLTEGEFLTAYYGSFYQVVNLTGLIMQLFLVSRVVKYLGVAVGLMILPLISLGAYGLIGFYPVLSYVRWSKTAENATDYSLNNTVRNMLFLPTTREVKYKAKQAIDSFFVRTGDMMSALLVLVGTTLLTLSTTGFAMVNIVAVLVWLLLAYRIGIEYKGLRADDATLAVEVSLTGDRRSAVGDVEALDLTDLDGPAWAHLAGGAFRMGSDNGDDARPVHEVRVSAFRISRFPVTNAQYAEFVRDTGRAAPSHWPDGGPPADKSNHPVTFVSWHDAQAFCGWLTERVGIADAGAHLPTEAQWEFAARGADGREYPWGNERPSPQHANYQASTIEDTTPVGSHPAGATPEGVHDLAGNVRQWCHDWYGDYTVEAQTDPAGPATGEGRALRGGAFIDAPGTLRGSYRFTVTPDGTFGFVGFRVAWSSHGDRSRG